MPVDIYPAQFNRNMHAIDPSADNLSSSPEVTRVLKALSLQRDAPWHLPGYYLGITYDSVDHHRAMLSMDLESNLNVHGQPLPVALCILADVALAASIRGEVGFETRLATISDKLTFTGQHATQRLVANSRGRFQSDDNAIAIRNSGVTILSGETEICFAEGSFAVLERPADRPVQSQPDHHSWEQIDLLAVNDLSVQENDTYQRALQALADRANDKTQPEKTTFTETFWGLTPTSEGHAATCEIQCGLHIGNRVGHVQGGVLLGLAINTSLATVRDGWRMLEINALFIRPGTEGVLTATSQIVNAGRNLAHVLCEIRTATGRLVLQAQSTMIRE